VAVLLYPTIKQKLTGGFFKPHCNQGTKVSFLICEWEEIAWETSTREVMDRPYVLHICWIFPFTANPDSVQLEQILLVSEEITHNVYLTTKFQF